ncbi:hypothetical protein KP509_39G014700 [Ceratopteris richardii]|uniref:Protein kinase domain-containing protein n=1 Tax=Ceratopteris richardii TaxID=49495 RepID=A0A8T2PZD0_CERRI|nr:hypothetical protein KP509_39G014700 [Ceratopteris richardii]
MLFRKNQQQHGNELSCLSIDGLTIGKLLGRGGFGKVFAVAKNTEKLEIMACKIFDMNGLISSNGVKLQAEVLNALQEIQVMKYLSSCSLSSIAPIVHLLDVYDASDGRPCAAMELCLGGSLFDLLQDKYRQEKTLTCREAALVIYKIGIALLFCHENHIVHLDVKPSNILFRHREDLSSAWLRDFGLSYGLFQTEAVVLGQKNGVSVEYINDKVFEGIGTQGYSAPELMNGGFLSKAADIWSLSATLLEMLTGEEVPVHSVAVSEWWAKDAATKLEQELSNRMNGWKELDSTAQDLILAMLCPDFMARLPLTHVLIHPWLLNNLFHAPPGQEDACTDASTTVE